MSVNGKPLGLDWHEVGDGWEYAWSPVEEKPYLLHHCKTAHRGFEISYALHHDIIAHEPLTLSPSVICTNSECQEHGWLRDGHWVPA